MEYPLADPLVLPVEDVKVKGLGIRRQRAILLLVTLGMAPRHDLVTKLYVSMMRQKCAGREDVRAARLAAIAAEANTLREAIMAIDRSAIAEAQERLQELVPRVPSAVPVAIATTENDLASDEEEMAEARAELANA
ncbi:hypothetical protein ACHAPU_008064 [Fusarium lateritium]